MSGPVQTTPTSRRAPSRSVRLITTAILAASRAAGAQECPAPVPPDAAQANFDVDPNQPVQFQADRLEATRDGEMVLQGDVVLTQGAREVRAREARYDSRTQRFLAREGLEYSDPELTVRGAGGSVDSAGGAEFEQAQFELRSLNARGGASRIRAAAEGQLDLEGVRYTTCPIGDEDWILQAGRIHIDQEKGFGVGRDVRLDFMGFPLLYTPFISFPVGNERKSGFLFPSIGTSSSSGYSFSAPWYWDIAPNYDSTLVSTWYSKRGAKLDPQFRYLTERSQGVLEAEYLPDDQEYGEDRSLVRFANRSDISDQLRLDVAAANASDSLWFEDFGLGPEGTSVTYLDRLANLTYLTDHWLATLRAQNFQTIADCTGVDARRAYCQPLDPTAIIQPSERPYTLLPQLAVQGWFPHQWAGLTFGFNAELTNFDHGDVTETPEFIENAQRFDVAPEIRLPLRGAGVFLEPALVYRYTAYRIDEPTVADDSLSRSLPIASLDGGLLFERAHGSRKPRLQTLEPRFLYLYAPYRNQDQLPVFDTTLADLNLVQLFRTNQYVGPDRVSNANQLSIGVTSRLLDARTGRQFITGTIGQAYYFDTPRVDLPPQAAGSPNQRVLQDRSSSDIIGELAMTAYENWSVSMGLQWDPGENRAERSDVRLQYKPANDRVANLSYRFRRDAVEQVDGSVAWPITNSLAAYARMVYSLKDSSELDEFAGLEYRSCCWRLRVLGRRYVSDRNGDTDASILVQLELNGLSSVGVGADAFLEKSIQGYSPRSP